MTRSQQLLVTQPDTWQSFPMPYCVCCLDGVHLRRLCLLFFTSQEIETDTVSLQLGISCVAQRLTVWLRACSLYPYYKLSLTMILCELGGMAKPLIQIIKILLQNLVTEGNSEEMFLDIRGVWLLLLSHHLISCLDLASVKVRKLEWTGQRESLRPSVGQFNTPLAKPMITFPLLPGKGQKFVKDHSSLRQQNKPPTTPWRISPLQKGIDVSSSELSKNLMGS